MLVPTRWLYTDELKEARMSITFPQPVTLNIEQATELMDKMAHRALNLSAAEFLAAWDAGTYRSEDTAEIAELIALIPFVR